MALLHLCFFYNRRMKTTDEKPLSDRAKRARARAKALAREQGNDRPADWERLTSFAMKEPDLNFPFDDWFRELRLEESLEEWTKRLETFIGALSDDSTFPYLIKYDKENTKIEFTKKDTEKTPV